MQPYQAVLVDIGSICLCKAAEMCVTDRVALLRSCVAGGFFASGFKRAFKMKDFGQTIPGHGGVTDRFDCQMIMAMFAYVYYWNYVASTDHTVGEALDVSIKQLPKASAEAHAAC
jgi:hypothetical protein